VRSLVSNSIYAKKDRNGPPSADQVASKDEPRCGHAVCKLPEVISWSWKSHGTYGHFRA